MATLADLYREMGKGLTRSVPELRAQTNRMFELLATEIRAANLHYDQQREQLDTFGYGAPYWDDGRDPGDEDRR